MTRLILIFSLLIHTSFVYNQQTISGYVYDFQSKEVIIGAIIYCKKYKVGTRTNLFGFYSLTIPTNDSVLIAEISFIGYNRKVIELNVKSEISNISLIKGITLNEVTVNGDKSIITNAEIGTIKLTPDKIRLLPNMFGEVDIIKAFQLTPGVESGGEGKSHLIVRGGSTDQNLILLDNVPIYSPSHFGGFFSVFNVDAINSVKLIKGGFPARYGGKLSSVLDIQLKEGNMNKLKTQGTIGLLSSKLTFEGPLVTDKMSFLVSGRKRLLPIFKLMGSGIAYDFYDFNAKLNYKISNKDRIYFSSYLGNDNVRIAQGNIGSKFNNNMKWGNKMAAFRWNHLFSKKVFSHLTFYNSNFKSVNNLEIKNSTAGFSKEVDSKLSSGINDLGLKYDLSYLINSKIKFKAGINSVYYSFTPNDEDYLVIINDEEATVNYESKINAVENSIYIENQIATRHFSSNIGLRYSTFLVDNKLYDAFEPRILLNYIISDNLSLKYAFSKMSQYMHLLTTSSVGTPNDFWMPTTGNISPEISLQHAFGISAIFGDGKFDISIEGYHKSLSELITFKPGQSLVGNLADWENVVESGGTGTNSGLELFLKKNTGKTTGWLSFTLSKASRQFENINNNEVFPFKYDRRINTSILVNHKFSEKMNISGTWFYGTGQPVTLASEVYFYDNQVVLLYNSKNSSRMRDYHRLDLAINFFKETKKGSRIWSISALNLYNRRNPYYYFYDHEVGPNGAQGDLKLYQRSLFGVLPSVSYSFTFGG